jgi:hypothetical protein
VLILVTLKPGLRDADHKGVGPGVSYDPRVIERFAEQLLRKADSVRVGSASVGGIIGVIFGAVPLTPFESVWPIPARFGVATMLIGALAGVLVGWVVGEGRAFRFRVQAQMALFQIDIERKVEAAVRGAVAPSAAPPVSTPAPVKLPPPLPPLLRGAEGEDEELPPLSPPLAL